MAIGGRNGRVSAVIAALAVSGCLSQPLDPSVDDEAAASFRIGPAIPFATNGPVREPHIAVREGDRSPVVVAIHYAYDRGDGPVESYDTPELILHRSLDGGATWTTATVPRRDIARPFDPDGRLRLGDPVLAYGPDGALYLSGTAFTPGVLKVVPVGDFALPVTTILATQTGVFVARSDDDGATWSPASFWEMGAPAGAIAPDKQWSDVGPDGLVHLVWMRFVGQGVRSQVAYTRSADGGGTWDPPSVLAEVGPEVGLHSPVVAASSAGRVYVTASEYPTAAGMNLFTGMTPPGGRQLAWASGDSGATFGPPIAVGEGNMFRFGHVAASPRDPLHAVAVGTEEADDHRVWFASTRDGGATWTKAARLSPDRGGLQRLPTVWIDAQDRAHVAYLDEGWEGGARTVRAVLDDDRVAFESVADGPSANTDFFFGGEYFGLDGAGTTSWAAWVGVDEEHATRLEAAPLGVGT